MKTPGTTTIAHHLVRRFKECRVDEGFGIVGDFALKLFDRLHQLDFPILVTADEQGAAFAADAYARLRHFGVCAVTYSVGGLKVANATAGAWAENVPLLILSGSPGLAERKNDPLLHHRVKTFNTQLEVFTDITVAQAVLNNPLTAAREIDRVISEMIAQQRPGYIEVPRDMVDIDILDDKQPLIIEKPKVHEKRLELAVEDALQWLRGAGDSVAIAGVMAVRRDLSRDLLNFVEYFGVPMASTSLSKGVIPETHPLALGVYMGAVSSPGVVERVEKAKPLISFGVLYADLVMGGFTDHLDRGQVIECTDTHINIGYRTYQDVPLWAFLPALIKAAQSQNYREYPKKLPNKSHFVVTEQQPLSVERIMACLASVIDHRHRLLIDPGDCLFGSVDLPASNLSLSSAYYATMGYAVPASLGAGRATPECRPVVLVGDGAFLMTALEALSAKFHGINPIIIVVDNKGYGTQRPMMDGPFNDIPLLKAEELIKPFGLGTGILCESEIDFLQAIIQAVSHEDLYIIRACVPEDGYSPALLRLTDALKKRI